MFKFLDPTGCTYYDGQSFQYNLPQRDEKWSAPTMHPDPVESDGKACGPGRLHAMLELSAKYAPANWWPWWCEGVGPEIGRDDEKASFKGLRLRRISPAVLARCLRPPFNWGRRADLCWTNLGEADLREANLRGADLRRAYHNTRTAWPAGFTPPEATP